MTATRVEHDSLGPVNVPADKLWGAETQRSLEYFSIGADLIPREMIGAYATLKKAAALANQAGGRLAEAKAGLIVRACDEILAGEHRDMFPLHVWMTGSGTQFNMNVNEVIANRCCQLAGTPLGSKKPVHPNDHVNMSQSSNDSFPSAMYIAAAVGVAERLLPLGDVHRRRDRHRAQPGPGGNQPPRRVGGEGRGVAGHRQDRPDPLAGRDAADPGPGVLGLCRHAGRQP